MIKVLKRILPQNLQNCINNFRFCISKQKLKLENILNIRHIIRWCDKRGLNSEEISFLKKRGAEMFHIHLLIE